MVIDRFRALACLFAIAGTSALRAPSPPARRVLPPSRGGHTRMTMSKNSNVDNNPFATLFASSPLAKPSSPQSRATSEGVAAAATRRYFDAWNRRDMAAAVAEFDEACVYEDTQYSGAFEGKEALKAHLNKVLQELAKVFFS